MLFFFKNEVNVFEGLEPSHPKILVSRLARLPFRPKTKIKKNSKETKRQR